ncbi:MAG TPA: hypothetical protein VHM91_14770 [Verrucomicrobiales bacterium]|nr:hypothetical protein [Verrucomicrobiales bacterium]
MKTHTASLFLLLLAAAASSFGETKAPAPEDNAFSPKEKPITTYDKLRSKSPFEFDPPKVQTVEAANPFEGISLAGYCGSGNTLTVYLLAGKEKKKITVFGDGSAYKKRDESGFRVVGINRGKTLKNTEITLEKDGRQGTVKFDEDTLHAKGPAAGVQMVRDQNGNMVPRPVIPRPGGAPAQPGQNNYQAPAPFIPGQSNPSSPQQNPQGMQQGGGNPNNNNITLPAGSLTNQQLMNQLTGPSTPQPQPQNGVVSPQPAPAGGNSVPPPSRRRVVLPTQ